MKAIPETILEIIRRAEKVVLLTHVRPDGDALGSAFALRDILEGIGKETLVFLEEPVSFLYAFMPGSGRVCTDIDEVKKFTSNCSAGSLLLVALDVGDKDRLGRYQDELISLGPLLVIDHHLPYNVFGDYRLIEVGISSTGEMVYELALALRATVTLPSAKNLFAAICSDTGSFRYESTKPRTMHIAADLLQMGVHPNEISSALYDNSRLPRLHLLKEVLDTLQLYADGRVAVVYLKDDMLNRAQAEMDDAEGFVEYPRSLRQVEVAIFFKEHKDGQVSVSLRSKSDFDVSEVARIFGGGGHRKAAGCRFRDEELAMVRERVLAAVNARLAAMD
ncbi:MAG: bifunctional oligoribonuclease/PAP phosphatase NrnA [Desulfobulbaceae bacterium]|jgi:phosphoesterase RecJ-like protein|nr:bifunctional oligoribonuclease/PAP phosphatase NrnA [Desulfobulbaceae bacterium]